MAHAVAEDAILADHSAPTGHEDPEPRDATAAPLDGDDANEETDGQRREEGDDGEDEGNGPSFFEEEAQCKALLTRLAELLPTPKGPNFCVANAMQLLPSVGQAPDGAAAVVHQLTKILDRYQECPHLLFPHLEGLVSPLVDLLLRYLPPAIEVWALEKAAAAAQAAQQKERHDEEQQETSESAKKGEPAALGRNYDMFDADAPKTPIHLVCHALYAIVKTAGEAACTSHFPNDVQYYEDVFYALRLWKNTDEDGGATGSSSSTLTAAPGMDGEPVTWASVRQREWEVRYCLLLWLCNLVLVPFSLRIIDSSAPAPTPTAADLTSAGRITSADSLSDAVLVTAVGYLADTSKCRDGAALLVARLLTRPDSRRHRDAFFGYAKALVDATVAAGGVAVAVGGAGEDAEEPYRHLNFLTEALAADAAAHPTHGVLRQLQGTFLLPGMLTAMSLTLKLGQRREMLPYASGLIGGVAALLRLRSSDALLCKTAVKVVQRLVLSMLKNTSASWKYKRHDIASLAANLGASAADDGTSRARVGGEAGGHNSDHDDDDDDVIEGDGEALEEGIGLLLETLAHKDTIVRWSSAAGVGRVCDRLPADMAQEVMEAVYECFTSAYDDAAWHGGLLALAELCRRSIIDAPGLDKVVPKIAKGLGFDLSKGTYSVGAHVRDAACYTCWSIARAYDAQDLEKHVHQLSAALVVAALFDREVNVRRAAAAAFQECVGRLGSFPNGIALVTAMDFFSLASRSHAFLEVAPVVAQYDAYRGSMLKELVQTKLTHWDRHVRRCAAGALGKIAAIEFEKNPSGAVTVIGDIFQALQLRVTDQTVGTRHGAILGLAELVRGGLPVSFWSEEQCSIIANVVVRLDQARLFRSRGGEHIRHACCLLLSACATVRLPLPEFLLVTKITGNKVKARTLGKFQEFMEESWKNILEWLQLAAAETFADVAAAYYVSAEPTFCAKVMQNMLDATAFGNEGGSSPKGTTTTQLERRGFLAAMGGLPTALLLLPQPTRETSTDETTATREPFFLPMLRHLSAAAVDQGNDHAADASPQQPQESTGDAESRRNAVRSLSHVLSAIPAGQPELTAAVYQRVLQDALLVALQDYAVDKRGDVGSFVRAAALQALPAAVAAGLRPAPGSTAGSTLLTATPHGDEPASAPSLSLRLLQGCVKAAMEKLDRVRGAAGAALVTLLANDITSSPFLATLQIEGTAEEARAETLRLQQLVKAIHSTAHADWSSPRNVITALGAPLLLETPRVFAQPAMEGLVVAAGDRSLHVQQPAMQAVLTAFRASAGAEVGRLSALVVAVGEQYCHTERVLVPLSRVLDTLLNEGLLAEGEHLRCVTMLRAELKHYATAITVVLPLVTLLATLCRSNSEAARQDAWGLSLTMIASRYPKVRARMATDLYTALLVLTSASDSAMSAADREGCTHAMNHLLRVQWDSSDAGSVRRARDKLYPMLGLTPPHKATSTGGDDDAAGTAKPTRTKVASTYASLVQETGY